MILKKQFLYYPNILNNIHLPFKLKLFLDFEFRLSVILNYMNFY